MFDNVLEVSPKVPLFTYPHRRRQLLSSLFPDYTIKAFLPSNQFRYF